MNTTLRIAVVGLGFGAEFVPIYLDHPDVASVAICDQDEERLRRIGERFGIQRRLRDVEEVIRSESSTQCTWSPASPTTPPGPGRAELGQTLRLHRADGHRLADLRAIVRRRTAGKHYMMMETAVYTRQFLHAQEMQEQGASAASSSCAGPITRTWSAGPPTGPACRRCGMPPTPSARCWRWRTRGRSACTALAPARCAPNCASSTAIPTRSRRLSSSSQHPDLAAEVTRTLFHCARPYMESFVIYGENACYEWQMEDEDPLLFSMSPSCLGRCAG